MDNLTSSSPGTYGETRWNECLKDLENVLNPQSFSSWFSPLRFCSNENNVLTLAAPNKFHIEFIEYNYWDTLSPVIDKYFPENEKLQFVINKDIRPETPDPLPRTRRQAFPGNGKPPKGPSP
ncbi:MAG: DnaA N-terminal domain-containing protein [Candidatus Marinimicrobia bacterium]|nr:DnaA N-terminal domain-containing protein [Candidatus Neomarinimicrobiota bacterium]